MYVTSVFIDFSCSYTWSCLVLVFFPFMFLAEDQVESASGGGLEVDAVLIAGGDGWCLVWSKSLTRENRERSPPPPPPRRRVIFFYFFVYFMNYFGQFFFWNALVSIGWPFVFWDGFCRFHPFFLFSFVFLFFLFRS